LDSKNQVVRRITSSDRPAPGGRGGAIADVWIVPVERVTNRTGMNRFVWDLRYPLPEGAGGGRGGSRGPQVLPGNYTVRLTAEGKTYTQPLTVALDPRSQATAADLQKQLDFSVQVMQTMKDPAARPLMNQLNAALGVAISADRQPPQQAIDLYEQAKRD